MIAAPVVHRLSTRQLIGVWTAVIIVALVGAVAFMLYVAAPLARDFQEFPDSSGLLTAIHQRGFVGVTINKIHAISGDDGYDHEAFTYQVGSCSMPIYILGKDQNARTYIWLKGEADTKLFVTLKSLKDVPQVSTCFRK